MWDFGGQADQRLVHQLYMDNAALILLVFDAGKEDVLQGLREWGVALERAPSARGAIRFLVAARIDAGFQVYRTKLENFRKEKGFAKYFETSAKDGTGCRQLLADIWKLLPWQFMTTHSSPRIFHQIKLEVIRHRDSGRTLLTL